MKIFGQTAFSRLAAEHLELEREHQELQEEANTAWREVGALGRRLADWNMQVKIANDADERVRRAESAADVAGWRNAALETFYTDLMAGKYDHGMLPVPQDATGEAEADLCKS